MAYYTVINCVDGRVQRPALDYLGDRSSGVPSHGLGRLELSFSIP